ncbi:MAG: MFS transporter, partial [Clostridia bacterium]|nr:MFS transporter [Clostridia bacterium]
VPLLMVQNLLFSFFNTINMVIPTEMIGDTIDYMEWKTGERNEGVSFSVLTFVGKLTGSISGTIGNWLLPVIGLSFIEISATETMTVKAYEYTDTLIWGMFTLAPAILGLLPLIPYIWYDLTGDNLQKVREEMTERRAKLSIEVSGGAENE